MKSKEIGYFYPDLLIGDIVKTSFGFWAVIGKSYCTDDISSEYDYSILKDILNIEQAIPSRLCKKFIEKAFEACSLEDIKQEYPEDFI